MSINLLVEMSNRYGGNAEYVLAGGGNTSFKDDKIMYVKGSGVSLADITQDGFVKMERSRLNAIFSNVYSDDPDTKEAEVLRDMMAARSIGEENKRPSVDALLHNILPYRFVLHVHPARVNGLTCSKNGESDFAKLFSNDSIWISQILPGYSLAVDALDKLDAYKLKNGSVPKYIFIENHGVFIGGNTVSEIDLAVSDMNKILDAEIIRTPDFSPCEYDKEMAVCIAPAIRALAAEGGVCVFKTNTEILKFVSSKDSFDKASPIFTTDHMLYCCDEAIFIEADDTENAYVELTDKLADYKARNNRMPKIVGLKNIGYYACGKSKKEADNASAIFLDAINISVYGESFSAAKPMKDELVSAIDNWKILQYTTNEALKTGRLDGKITIITGSAQGFGLGIAEEMASQGAYLAIADLNVDGAVKVADHLNARFGSGTAIGLKANVADEENVKDMVYDMVLAYGGLDIFVNNAGIVKAGGVDEMNVNAFELVTKVNYTAYFLCVKYASKIMKIQNRFMPDIWFDIIQINSKSGLEGSKRNFAYAGSKFGGIGLTASFALELVENNIKVNSICPGNFLGGPLWCDPESGLFVQYLKAGKIPGAKTIGDVKKAYEAKVPMGRGCEVIDVARAIYYVVEQDYETGQAIPVTGGQIMLR